MANTTGEKFWGRSKRMPNKTSKAFREAFTELLEDNIGNVRGL